MDLIYRFIVGGLVVSLFSLIADVLRPKGFAGLFAAAPAVALATLSLALLTEGRPYAALEARSMVVGAIAFFFYALACTYLMSRRHLRASIATIGMLPAWGLCALLFGSLLLAR